MYNGSTVIVRVALLTVIIHIDEILGTNDFAELATNFKSFSTSKKMFHCHEFIEVCISLLALIKLKALNYFIFHFRNC